MSTTNETLLKVAERMSEEEAEKQAEEFARKISNATGREYSTGKAPDIPDIPPCDNCGKEFEGKHCCSRCKCVFYCSQECQRNDWKRGGHKNECATMEQQCEEAAQAFVETANEVASGDESITSLFNNSLWHALDGAGPYKKALALNLNTSLQALLENDRDSAKFRYTGGILGSLTQMVRLVERKKLRWCTLLY
jgi:hypothetical protein